jgi:negative regulator of replication initiation
LLYQNIADEELDAGESANFIISQMKAFNMTAQDAEHIIDAVNEV